MKITLPIESKRFSILINGIVQGVGFRPFIYRLAKEYNLKGFVLNNSKGVAIDIEGSETDLKRFFEKLKNNLPPLSNITELKIKEQEPKGYPNFSIKESIEEKSKYIFISPDIATCELCLEELLSQNDRRFRYPFINCTNCGPRFTIITDLPYDRPKTTMAKFKMCNKCSSEYNNPLNRRFHAQPNACERCGPQLKLIESSGKEIPGDPISETAKLLREGKIVAIKGIGGFHLACDAKNYKSVENLRKRKIRTKKPFAIMAKNIKKISEFCKINQEEKKLLTSARRPIVLLEKINDKLAKNVSPNLKHHGVMLPYTPLHHLLFEKNDFVLVMTSGNLSDEPLIYKNNEAIEKLSNIADYILLHNRDIQIMCDDSVTRSTLGKEMIIRRARGYTPEPIELPFSYDGELLACGAELKNTFCLIKKNYAFLSQHLGNLEKLETLQIFEKSIKHFEHLFSINPKIIACDLHPEYLSTKYAMEIASKEYPPLPIQHHHAHIASCMVENKLNEKIIGVAFDGLGYGKDRKLWGGEFLIADYTGFERLYHLEYIPMPGSAKAIKEPWRMAISYLFHAFGKDALNLQPIKNLEKAKVIIKLLEKKINSPLTSSIGRLFDAVSSILNICHISTYEAQAAMELEAIADEDEQLPYQYDVSKNGEIHIDKIIAGIVHDINRGTPTNVISAKFHETIADMIANISKKISEKYKIKKVALSGGVFQNVLLLEKTIRKMEKLKLQVYTHHTIPPNDGGISLGQAAIASFISKQRCA